jgi:hypothetical protein
MQTDSERDALTVQAMRDSKRWTEKRYRERFASGFRRRVFTLAG